MPVLPVEFEHPVALLLLLLIVPAAMIAWRSIGSQSHFKTVFTFALRVIVILLITTALSNPTWEKRGEGLTATVILDRSDSIPLPLKQYAVDFLREAARNREHPEDRVACLIVGRDATMTSPPHQHSIVTVGLDDVDTTETNLAAGVRLALAVMPDDTANRIILASDGNETVESVTAAAELARANDVPIDVLILEYEHTNEVLFDRIIAPTRARLGQTIPLRMVLRSTGHAAGTLSLRMNDEPIDLDPAQPGTGLHLELEPGVRVISLSIRLDDAGPAQFRAAFEPDGPEDDMILQNNSAIAVTFVSGEGRVLVIDESEYETETLVRALQLSEISVDRRTPDALAGGLVFLSGYDALVLANVPRWALDDQQDRMLHAYVHDLGGGLVMLGGPQSFGAGGWIESETARVLPVKLDPPHVRQMPRGALALVMHATEMPQGNHWGQEVARSAINALSSMDYVGIIEYDWSQQRQNLMGATWAFPMQLAGDKQAALAATRRLVMGDMKDFGPMLQLAYDGLTSARAGQRHIIIISDGDPARPSDQLMQQIIDAQITITTVMVVGHGSALDRQKMQAMANLTGGRFYHVLNPTQLPAIFIKEAQMVSRSLIQEGDYQPQVVSRLPGPVDGFPAVPPVRGYVLTAMRDGLAQTPIAHVTEEGQDPIYAHWNYGLGKSTAYTSDLMGRWGPAWVSWDQFQAFWSQSMRWVMRPSSPANFQINTRTDGDVAVVEVEATDADARFLNFLQVRAVVVGPDSTAHPLLLQQVGPGRYRGEFRTDGPGAAGAYLVNVHYTTPGGTDTRNNGVEGNMQAAVTVPYSREYRDLTHNAALMERLASMTGGRVLTASSLGPEMAPDPSLVNLFEREFLQPPRSPRHIWDLLAIIAACLFILDVAARRLAIDTRAVARGLRRAVGRREQSSDATVAAWKRAREQVAHRKAPHERAGSSPDQRVGSSPSRTTRFEAGEADKAVAIDVGGEPGAPPRDEKPADTSPQRPTDEKEAEDQGPHTSRLLAARRRARGEDDPGQGENQ